MTHATAVDFDKYRLRSFVERLIELGEVEIQLTSRCRSPA